MAHEGETPAENIGYVLDFDEAREAAELNALIQDLNYVTEVCALLEERLLGRETEEQEDEEQPVSIENNVERSLWVAALTTYARCFLKGVRSSLPESLFLRTPGMDYTHLHRYYMNIRDKHVAHSVNALEAHDAVVTLDRTPDGTLKVATLGMLHMTLVHLHHSEVQQLGNMAGYASDYARERYEELSQRTLDKALALSQEELSKLRPYEFRGREGFVSPDSTQSMYESRRGRKRKKRAT